MTEVKGVGRTKTQRNKKKRREDRKKRTDDGSERVRKNKKTDELEIWIERKIERKEQMTKVKE
jgi:hypothetical protein